MGMLSCEMLLLLCLSLAILAMGFRHVLYFINIGFAATITAMALFASMRHFENIAPVAAVQNILLVLWGLRLGAYIVRRERSASYRQRAMEIYRRCSEIPWGVRGIVWITVAVLYVLMFSPSLLRLAGQPVTSRPDAAMTAIIGLLMMAGGLVLETVADRQKSGFKTRFPDQFCDTGLYRLVRCPNYFGEILFWTGNWTAGLVFYTTGARWAAGLTGLACIIWIMLVSTKRLEKAQDARYGVQPGYQRYVRTVPVIFPGIPVYSLKNIRGLL